MTELSHISLLHYSDYCRPVETGECGDTDTKKLWLNIEKALKLCLSTVHLREVASSQIREMQRIQEDEDKAEHGRSRDREHCGTVLQKFRNAES